MTKPYRFLVAESEAPEERAKRRASTGRSSGETYADTLRDLVPGAVCEHLKPAEDSSAVQTPEMLRGFDAVFLCGSPMHIYEDTPETRRVLAFMRAVYESGTPSFGSCAGLQVAVAAAGGKVGPREDGQEAGFARRITPTEAGRMHKLMAGRPGAFDAPAIHSDEVKELPDGATLLATSLANAVQAVEIRLGDGVFWGVQYHPELPLSEIADALRRQWESLVKSGLAADEAAVMAHADRVDALAATPDRRDLAWQLGLDEQVTATASRQRELRNFIQHLVEPTRQARAPAVMAA